MLDVISRYPVLAACEADILAAEELLIAAFRAGHKLLICGNGGSCADAGHIAGELGKGFVKKRPLSPAKRAAMAHRWPCVDPKVLDTLQDALPVIPLDLGGPLGSAFSNDVSPNLTYAQQVLGLAREGDALLCISTSGNSANIVEAAGVARALGATVIALTGETGGQLYNISHVTIRAPERETYKVQELHLPIYHQICLDIEKALFA